MVELYPKIEPYASGYVDVGNEQQLYWETVGNPSGTPALYLHGGPGSGSSLGARRHFDPEFYRAVLFDQRGCGRSRPLVTGSNVDLSANTTDHLIADIETLREYLGIEQWVVVGASWGVTLGLVYAQRHPERVPGMVLGAVTLGSKREIDWITQDMSRIFPREWERFASIMPKAERDDLPAGYARLLALAGSNAKVREQAALEWCKWEDTHVSLMPGWKPSQRYKDPQFRIVFARLVTHYWSHGCFLEEGEVLAGAHRLVGIPGVLIHGRWDISSPLDTAWMLHRAWPDSQLIILEDAGHGGGGFPEAMTTALNGFRNVH